MAAVGIKFGGKFVAKLGFTGFALAGCLALTSCNTTGGIHLASAFDYPEAKTYMSCFIDHARKRAISNKKQLENEGIDSVLIDTYGDCEPIQKEFDAHARANGLSDTKIVDLSIELRTKASDLAWDEIARIRLAQLKAEGKVR
ncbi:hypothetical protein [Pleomorphomonas sp. PLEO]|uniref:hypothetical protein n=1 Tax=Pleomorphomonas sp. PLEO TaxID=3239306 RepID=UPI00351E6387